MRMNGKNRDRMGPVFAWGVTTSVRDGCSCLCAFGVRSCPSDINGHRADTGRTRRRTPSSALWGNKRGFDVRTSPPDKAWHTCKPCKDSCLREKSRCMGYPPVSGHVRERSRLCADNSGGPRRRTATSGQNETCWQRANCGRVTVRHAVLRSWRRCVAGRLGGALSRERLRRERLGGGDVGTQCWHANDRCVLHYPFVQSRFTRTH